MKKLIFLIPFVLIFFSCGDVDSPAVNSANPNSDTSSVPSGTGDSGDVTNPEGSGGSGTTTGEGGNTGGETNPEGEGGGDTTVDVTDPKGDGNDNTTVVVDPGGDTGGGVIVDIDPGGDTGQVVIVHPDEEEKKQEKEKQAINHSISTTAFNAIDISKLYYRSTLKNSEDLANYDNVYNALKVFYGEQNKDAECTAGVLCHATDVFVDDEKKDIVGVVWCLDDNRNLSDKCKELGGVGNERYVVVINGEKWEMPTADEVYGGMQWAAWKDANCMKPNGERGYYTVQGTNKTLPVCSDLEYSLKVADKKYSSVIGVPVVRSGVTTGSPYLSIPEIEKLVQLDMHNLYLFGITNDMWSPAYKIQPLSNFSSTGDLHTQWVTQMQAIHKKLYDVYGDYTTKKYDFETLYQMFRYVASYYENGASDIAGILDLDEINTGKLNNIGYARALAFVCQLASSDSCIYVEGKANYSTGYGNRGGQEFDHAWLKVGKVNRAGSVVWTNFDPVRNLDKNFSDCVYDYDTSFYNDGYKANNKDLLPVAR